MKEGKIEISSKIQKTKRNLKNNKKEKRLKQGWLVVLIPLSDPYQEPLSELRWL